MNRRRRKIGHNVAMSGGSAGNTRAEASRRSRQRLLDLGVELLYEGLRSPIVGVRATEVAARSEWSAGAFYHHWPTQDAYRDDLRDYLSGQLDLTLSVEEVVAAVVDMDTDPGDAIRSYFRQHVRDVLNDRAWWLQVAMLASGEQHDRATVEEHMTGWIDLLEQFYAELLSLLGLEMRPGFSLNWLTRSIMAIVDGYSFQLRAGLSLELGPEHPGDGTWENPDLALVALVAVSVKRVEDDADHDIDALWNRLVGRPT